MNRCFRHPRRPGPAVSTPAAAVLALALLAPVLAPAPARAQATAEGTLFPASGLSSEAAFGGRNFPDDALRGQLRVIDVPTILLDGREDRFSPGVRIRDARNLSVVSAAITGQDLRINYTRDAAGLVREVWVLSPDEARAPRATASRPLLDFWPFVSPGARDDARTPFAELPAYGQ